MTHFVQTHAKLYYLFKYNQVTELAIHVYHFPDAEKNQIYNFVRTLQTSTTGRQEEDFHTIKLNS